MSDPMHPGAPAAKARPATVTISSYLLLFTALLFLIGAVVGLATIGTVVDVYRDAYAGTSVEGTESVITVSGVAGAVVQLLLAGTFVVLALLNNRGRNASRILTWVLGGLGVCCTGANLAGSALTGLNTGTGGDMPDPAVVQERLAAALPGWVEPVTLITTLLALLALLAAIILLALPPSNEFFRRAKATAEPPMPGATYPGYPQTGQPGYPQAPSGEPGYPQTGQPGYPQAPSTGPGQPGERPAGPGDQPSGPPSQPPAPPHS